MLWFEAGFSGFEGLIYLWFGSCLPSHGMDALFGFGIEPGRTSQAWWQMSQIDGRPARSTPSWRLDVPTWQVTSLGNDFENGPGLL
tara:strand:+ start:438 stop:695 length:258 start_codon:yes stop_codon:yes gene_type:complete